jgi:hypothetical protein
LEVLLASVTAKVWKAKEISELIKYPFLAMFSESG